MSIIGEIKDEEIQDLKEQHKADLSKFAEWLGDEEFIQVGYNVWRTSKYNKWEQSTYYTTEQVVNKFLKENK